MSGLIERSRIPISLVSERLIAQAARDEGVSLDRLEATPSGRKAVFTNAEPARRMILTAIGNWQLLAPSWTRLNFTMQHQEQTNWCWAATSVSVAAYYDPHTSWTQCGMVNAELGQTTCCTDGSTAACNQGNTLDAPLTRADVLDHMQAGSVGYDVIQQQIDGGRPLAWRIQWSGGGGHFAAIEGYESSGAQWVAVDDPWYGPTDVAVSTLTGGVYQGTGSWTHTYFTRRRRIPPINVQAIHLPWEIWERVQSESFALEGGR